MSKLAASTSKPPAAEVASTTTNPEDATRSIGVATPVEVSLWVSAYTSTAGEASGGVQLPGAAEMISGGSRWVASWAARANLELNSPNTTCWLRRAIKEKTSASHRMVVPPTPMTTS